MITIVYMKKMHCIDDYFIFLAEIQFMKMYFLPLCIVDSFLSTLSSEPPDIVLLTTAISVHRIHIPSM